MLRVTTYMHVKRVTYTATLYITWRLTEGQPVIIL